MTAESRDFSSGHSAPCEELKDMVILTREMNWGYVEDITGIKGDIRTIKEYMTNHWNEIEKDRNVLNGKIVLIDKHELLLNGLAKEKLNSVKAAQWRVGLIAGGIPSAIVVILKIVEMLMKK